jgi:hypothetical protein
MIWLGCGGGGWFECLVAAISKAMAPVVEGLIKLIFQPILDALFDAVGKLMATIATFWVFVPTQSVGNTTTGQPTSDTVGWIWSHTSWIAVFAATISVIVAGAHMAWSQRGEAARDLLRSLLTLAVASALAISVTQILIEVGDQFSKCIVLTALDNSGAGWTCQMQDATATNFGKAMLGVLGLVSGGGFSPIGIGLLITIGVITVLATVIQIVLMVVRSAMLILLIGVLPIAAAATNTEMGRGWFKRIISWLVAFVLYKPVAALVYATAIRLTQGGPLAYKHAGDPNTGTNASVGTDIMNMVTGLTLLMLALFALPALMKFIAPMVAATAGGAGAGAIAGKMVGMGMDKVADQASEAAKGQSDGPTGARNVGRPSSGSSSQPSGPEGAQPSPQPTGGAGGGAGGAAEGAAVGGEAAGSGAAASSGAAAGGAAAGGAAAGGGAAAAGAAGGPVGLAVVAGVMAVKKGAEMAGDAARSGVEETVNNDAMDGPSGSG